MEKPIYSGSNRFSSITWLNRCQQTSTQNDVSLLSIVYVKVLSIPGLSPFVHVDTCLQSSTDIVLSRRNNDNCVYSWSLKYPSERDLLFLLECIKLPVQTLPLLLVTQEHYFYRFYITRLCVLNDLLLFLILNRIKY